MALTSIGYLEWPIRSGMAGASFGANILLDAAGESMALITHAPKTGTIDKVSFRTATVTTGATVDVRIETVNASTGDPSGTLFGTTTNVAHTIADTDDNLFLTTNSLTAGAAVNRGDPIAVVIVNPAGSPGNFNLCQDNGWHRGNLPYGDHYTASWARTAGVPVVALTYNDGSVATMPHVPAWKAFASNQASTSATVYHGNQLTMPFTCRAVGMWHVSAVTGAAGVYTAKVFDTDGATALATATLDTDIKYAALQWASHVMFPSTVTLQAGRTYWLALTSDGTADLRYWYWDYQSTAFRDACAEGSSYCSYATATSPTGTGDWTNTATRVLQMGLIIDQIDVSSGPLVGPGRLIRN